MAFTRVAAVGEIAPGTCKQVTVGTRTLGVYNVGGTFYAIDDVCTHRGAPLSEGEVIENEVICPWHGARFNVTSGAACSPPATKGVACYKTQVNGDAVEVDVP